MRYADRRDFSASVDNSIRTLRNSSYHTKAEFSNCLIFIQYISLTSLKHPYLLLDFCENFRLFLQLVVIKRFFSVADIPQKRWFHLSSNIFCVFLRLFRSVLVCNSAILLSSLMPKQLSRNTATWKQGCAFILGNMLVSCLHLFNMIIAGWLWRIIWERGGGLSQSQTEKYFDWMIIFLRTVFICQNWTARPFQS